MDKNSFGFIWVHGINVVWGFWGDNKLSSITPTPYHIHFILKYTHTNHLTDIMLHLFFLQCQQVVSFLLFGLSEICSISFILFFRLKISNVCSLMLCCFILSQQIISLCIHTWKESRPKISMFNRIFFSSLRRMHEAINSYWILYKGVRKMRHTFLKQMRKWFI